MRKDTLELLKSNEKWLQFVRENPIWYRKLTRSPANIPSFEIASKNYYKQSIPYKVEKFSNSLEFASMMMQMYQAMRSGD